MRNLMILTWVHLTIFDRLLLMMFNLLPIFILVYMLSLMLLFVNFKTIIDGVINKN